MVELLPRSAWTDTEPAWSRDPLYVDAEGIAVHWPAARRPIGTDRAAVAAALRAYRRHHVVNRDWPDIGYNYAIDQAGRAWTLAGRRQAAHAASDANPDANARLYGVLFVVGMDEKLTPAAVAGFRELRAELGARLPVMGHRDVRGAQTACPGPHVLEALDELRAGASSSPRPPASPAPDREDYNMDRLDLRNAHRSTVRGRHMDQWQALLMAAGYGPAGLVDPKTGRPDGKGGAKTREYTAAFQRKHNTGDGKGNADLVVGPASWRAALEL